MVKELRLPSKILKIQLVFPLKKGTNMVSEMIKDYPVFVSLVGDCYQVVT
jgi:hypothetical protein